MPSVLPVLVTPLLSNLSLLFIGSPVPATCVFVLSLVVPVAEKDCPIEDKQDKARNQCKIVGHLHLLCCYPVPVSHMPLSLVLTTVGWGTQRECTNQRQTETRIQETKKEGGERPDEAQNGR